MNKYSHAACRFVAKEPLTRKSVAQLAACFRSPDEEASHRLGGRGAVAKIHIDSIGPVVVKPFRRGGILAHWVKKTYVRTGKIRAQIEFEQLEAARKIGIQTPEPVAFAYKGGLFYQNWLVTREIQSVQSLVQLSHAMPQSVPTVLQSLGRQITLLIDHRILHADFHPGNVLVGRSGEVYLVDFDKAATVGGDRQRLRLRYQRRWCRAVQKHGLPEVLSKDIHTWLV